MRNRVMSILLVVTSRIIAAGALTTFQAVAVLAAGDCATKPNVRTPPGGHWYYHVDAVSNRKCWFLRQEEVEGSPAPSSQAQSPTDIVRQLRSTSWFSSLASAFSPTSGQGQGQAPQSENGTIRNAPDAPKREEFLKKEPQIPLQSSHKKQPPKLGERLSAPPSEKQILDQRSTALDQASSDALFRQFLLWQERQSTLDMTHDQTDRDALFREFLLWNDRQRDPKAANVRSGSLPGSFAPSNRSERTSPASAGHRDQDP